MGRNGEGDEDYEHGHADELEKKIVEEMVKITLVYGWRSTKRINVKNE